VKSAEVSAVQRVVSAAAAATDAVVAPVVRVAATSLAPRRRVVEDKHSNRDQTCPHKSPRSGEKRLRKHIKAPGPDPSVSAWGPNECECSYIQRPPRYPPKCPLNTPPCSAASAAATAASAAYLVQKAASLQGHTFVHFPAETEPFWKPPDLHTEGADVEPKSGRV